MPIAPGSRDENLIYQGSKKFIVGERKKMRQIGPIRAFLNENAQDAGLARLLENFTMDDICLSVQALLRDNIFGKKKKAAERFHNSINTEMPAVDAAVATTPITIATSPVTDTQTSAAGPLWQSHSNPLETSLQFLPGIAAQLDPTVAAASEIGLAPTPADVPESASLQVIGQVHEPSTTLDPTSEDDAAKDNPIQTNEVETTLHLSSSKSTLPYAAQYRLLVEMQTCLEIACFHHAKEHSLSLLTQEKWDYPEAIELNKFIQCQKRTMSQGALGQLTPEIATTMVAIRHAAVHRSPLSNEEMDEFLQMAREFLEILGDRKSRERIISLRQSVCETLRQLEVDEENATLELEMKQSEIERKRAELQELQDAYARSDEESRKAFRNSAADNIRLALTSEDKSEQSQASPNLERAWKLMPTDASYYFLKLLCLFVMLLLAYLWGRFK